MHRKSLRTIITLASLLLLPLAHLESQSLDEDFISSLPDNLQADFKSALNENDEDENIYSPDTRILKLEESLKDAERTLQNLRTEIDRNNAFNQSDELKRFGDNFFSTYQSSFLPINEPNPSNDYILDFGDKLLIQVIGQINDEFEVDVNRDGTINIPLIGSMVVSGLPFSEVINLIKSKISKSYVGVQSFVTISELRDLNVLIVGNAFNPGMYTLPGGSTPLSLISVAGGINESGSYRKITHKRNNESLQNIDLYEILVNGNLSFKHSLRSGDVLVVHPKQGEIKVSGGIANAGYFEFLNNETIGQILEMSGVLNPSDDKKVYLERFNGKNIIQKSSTLKEINGDIAINGDSITVLNIEPDFKTDNTVTISGEVNLPGKYTLPKGAKLSELISRAGAYTPRAYPFGGVHSRKMLIKKEQESIEKSYQDLVKFLVSSGTTTTISDNYINFLSLIKDYTPTGRLVSEFNLDTVSSDPSRDRVLEDGDTIHVPSFQPDVYIFGEVMFPGAQRFDKESSPIDYIKQSGGLSRSADKNRMIVVHPNGTTSIIESSLFNSFQKNQVIYPGSVIFVPRYIGKVDGINLAATVAPIMSSLAISLASLNSINN